LRWRALVIGRCRKIILPLFVKSSICATRKAVMRDDFKMPVRHAVVKKVKPRSEPKEPKITEEERRASVEKLKEWRLKCAGIVGF
jgi:hypothetical protein